VNTRDIALPVGGEAEWRDYYALLKPRVMSLVVFTAACGLFAAPMAMHPVLAFTAILCIAVGAGASGALNMWYEADIDALMKRTAQRPLVTGRIAPDSALAYAVALSALSVMLMGVATNWVAAALLLGAILFYVIVYTMWLKRSTPQNIVIGGAAGAFPPMIGWAAATGDVTLLPLILFAIIFVWTPPHFWALALFVNADYAKAGVPMMPVVKGVKETRRQIGAYSWLLLGVSAAPWPLGLTGSIYGVAALVLGGVFTALAVLVQRSVTTEPSQMQAEKRLFAWSVFYLFALFAALVVDRFA
jgi:heme o synthase